MTEQELIDEMLETVSYAGDVRDWREVPELDNDEEGASLETLAGEAAGHAFHGNQWTDAELWAEVQDVDVELTRKLTKRELNVIEGWTGKEFRYMNEGLRGKAKIFPSDRWDTKILIGAISAGRTTEDVVLIRGVSPNTLKHMTVGTEFHDRGFVSLTSDPEVAAQFSQDVGKIVKIQVPKGTRLLDVSDAMSEHRDDFLDESEFLLRPDTRFKVVSLGDTPVFRIVP